MTKPFGQKLAAVIIASLFCATVFAQDAPTAEEVLQAVNARNDGESLTRTINIVMTDKRGKTREQTAAAYRKYFEADKKSAIFYLEPANIKDTAFLTFDYAEAGQDDDQWLYIPELRRVRRISSSNRGDYYLGTDFTYEDMKLDTRLSADDYTWSYVGTEQVEGNDCHVIEGIPVSEDIAEELGYGKYKAFVDSEYSFVRKTEVWDVNGNELKTVLSSDWEQIDDIWAAGKSTAENRKTSHKTVFTFTDIDYASEIDDDLFTEQALKRGAPRR